MQVQMAGTAAEISFHSSSELQQQQWVENASVLNIFSKIAVDSETLSKLGHAWSIF